MHFYSFTARSTFLKKTKEPHLSEMHLFETSMALSRSRSNRRILSLTSDISWLDLRLKKQ